MKVLEFDGSNVENAGIACLLAAGHVVILRNLREIHRLREQLIRYVDAHAPNGAEEVSLFYRDGTPPSLQTLVALSDAIKQIRTFRFVSIYLARLVSSMGFGTPVRLDGGIPRLVLPPNIVAQARASGLFTEEDFQRKSPEGLTEIFMPGPANIHRDYNRKHYLFQCNIWFPMHNLSEDETLRIWPEKYRQQIVDMPASDSNLAELGPAYKYNLRFGDAILFHSEHLHTSPNHTLLGYRRHTYDFRIASYCPDDTLHYRDRFLDIRNFDRTSHTNELPELSACLDGKGKWKCALPLIAVLENRSSLSEEECKEYFDAFGHFPFCEDRYVLLAQKAIESQLDNAALPINRTLQESKLCFWLTKLAKKCQDTKHSRLAEALFQKAELMSNKEARYVDFMPIVYENPATQP